MSLASTVKGTGSVSVGDAVFAWGRSCVIQPGLSLGTPEALLNALLFAPAAFFAGSRCVGQPPS